MDFYIDESKWRAGDVGEFQIGEGETCLLNDESYMCCLGQICLQLGCSEKDIKNVATPGAVKALQKDILTEICGSTLYGQVNNNLSIEAMEINDNFKIETDKRKERLIELFKIHGHSLKFI